MSIPVHCPHCGYTFTSRAFNISNASNVTLVGNRETCPRCRKLANIQDGTYDFVGRVLTAFRAPNVTRNDVLAFQHLATEVQAGKISTTEAGEQLQNLSPPLSELWTWANENGTALGILIGIIGIFIAIYYGELSRESEEQQHSDFEKKRQVIERQIETTEKETKLQKQIYEELKRLRKPSKTDHRPKQNKPKKRENSAQRIQEAGLSTKKFRSRLMSTTSNIPYFIRTNG